MIGNRPIPEFPTSRYKGTVTCRWCKAEYKPENWVRGYDLSAGTTLPRNFHAVSNVPDNNCPLCLKVSG